MAVVMALTFIVTGCSGQYKGMPRAEVLTYQTHATYGQLHALSVAYAECINAAVKEDTLHPGMYADYGVSLALMGHRDAACRMLNAEMRAFPESRGMVQRIKQRLLPDMVGDTLAPLGDTADIALLQSWAYDSLSGLRPFVGVAPVIDSTDTVWVRKQTPVDSVQQPLRLSATQKREMLEEQQNAALLAKQAYADSVAAAKQAKIDSRKQAKAEKEKAKKQKEKDKAKAEKQKKKLEKQKQKERQQLAADKKKEQERLAAEKKKQRAQESLEKQRQREQEAAEKKAQRELEAAEKKAQRELEAAERKAQREQEAAERKAQREQEAAERKAQREQKGASEE